MKKLERNEDTVLLYIQALIALKNWKLRLVVMNRHHTKGRLKTDFCFMFTDTTGTTHFDTGIKVFDADYLFVLLDLQKHFPSVELLDLTADKDNPLKNCVRATAINVDTVSIERSEDNDISTDTAT